jgi:hypothetical protein
VSILKPEPVTVTVTHGRIATEASFTKPSIDPRCSCAAAGKANSNNTRNAVHVRKRMGIPSSLNERLPNVMTVAELLKR